MEYQIDVYLLLIKVENLSINRAILGLLEGEATYLMAFYIV